MPGTQTEDEPEKVSFRNQLSLSLSRHGASALKGRRLNPTYLSEVVNTVHPLKRKLDSGDPFFPSFSEDAKKPNLGSTNMLNGYRSFDVNSRTSDDATHSNSQPVATLSNMGNTCYLNSVLYTLRFAPTFVHNLHHLVADLALVYSKINQTKAKSSSLGRTIGSITGPSSRSSSSKDLLSLGNSQNDLHPKTKMQIATEKLHELYMSLHNLEMKESVDPYQPASFIDALIEVNSIYQGNQQQDAHELLVYLLDILRETCDLLAKQAANQPDLLSDSLTKNAQSSSTSTLSGKARGVRRSWKKQKEPLKKIDKDKAKEKIMEEHNQEVVEEPTSSDNASTTEFISSKKIGYNFVSEEFGGITLRRTKCLECESVTERKEPFYDICVPVSDTVFEESESDFYKQACVTTENLMGSDKYWCERCIRYNEARREVSYERLPNLLVLQLKRFSSTANGTEKVNNYIPSPLILECFCDKCSNTPDGQKLHSYQLFSVIMHLGSTMASGHYIAYTRASDYQSEYVNCCRDHSKLSNATAEKSLNFFKYFKPKSLNLNNDKSTLNHFQFRNGSSHEFTSCKSLDCCGIKFNKSVIENAINNSAKDTKLSLRNDQVNQINGSEDAHLWLECDDDVIRTFSTKEFQKLLNCKRNSPATPYLLFYSKIKDVTHVENNTSD